MPHISFSIQYLSFYVWLLFSKITSSPIPVLNGNISVFPMAESKKDKLIGTESVMVVDRCWELGEMGRCQSKGTRLPTRWLSSGDLVYSMVTKRNNILLYTWKLLRGNTLLFISLRYTWHITLCKFKVYIVLIWYVYILQSD